MYDSILYDLLRRYESGWSNIFPTMEAMNFDVRGYRLDLILYRVVYGLLPLPTYVVINAGTNNIRKKSPIEVADGINILARVVSAMLPRSKIIISGLFPRGKKDSRPRDDTRKVNEILASC